MAKNWIDALDERDVVPEPEPAIKAVPDDEEISTPELEQKDTKPSRVKDPTKGFHFTKTMVASALAIVGVVGVVGASLATLANSVGDGEEDVVAEAPAEQASTVGVEAASGAMGEEVPAEDFTDTQVSIGTDCSDDVNAEVDSENSPRSAVTAFENAYFAQDGEGVKEAVSPESGLYDRDWDEVLQEAAPEGTTWCATMPPADGDAVDVDLEMSLPHERPVVYRQTATAEQHNGEWLITEISARED